MARNLEERTGTWRPALGILLILVGVVVLLGVAALSSTSGIQSLDEAVGIAVIVAGVLTLASEFTETT